MSRALKGHIAHAVPLLKLTLVWLLVAAGCSGLTGERVLYEERGIQIGIQHDPTTDRGTPAATNSHPARLSPEELRRLLGQIKVSGYTGTVAGLLVQPQPIPLFTEELLPLIATPLSSAFGQAGPQDRIFFSVPNLNAPYEPERTAGALFLRGPHLHLLLTDHTAFPRTDTAGGEDDRDIRDTKGMKLWVPPAIQAPQTATPRWGSLEKVSVSLNVKEALVIRAEPGPPQAVKAPPTPTGTRQPATQDPAEALRLQVQELTQSNLDLRDRLKQQAQDMEALKNELARIRQELEKPKGKTPARRKSPAP